MPTDPHPHTTNPPFEASMRAKVIAPRLIVANVAPFQSSPRFADSFRLSGTRHSVSQITAAAKGRLIKKTHRHETFCTSQPPSTGPIAAVIAVKPDQVPMARPRSFSENDALIRARLPGTSRAAPTP